MTPVVQAFDLPGGAHVVALVVYPPGSASGVFIPIAATSILMGPNGAGKSTLLRTIVEALQQDDDPWWPIGETVDVFLRVPDQEIENLRRIAAAGASAPKAPSSSPPGPVEDVGRLAQVRSIPVESAAALWHSPFVYVSGISTLWCSSVTPASDRAQLTESDSVTINLGHARAARASLPLVINVPDELSAVRRRVKAAILRRALTWLDVEALSLDLAFEMENQPVSDARLEAELGKLAWVEDPEDQRPTVSPLMLRMAELVSALATRIAPPFVSERYRLSVRIEPILRWGPAGPELNLLTSTADGSYTAPVAAMPDGYKLWVQLALLEALATLEAAPPDQVQQFLESSSDELDGAWDLPRNPSRSRLYVIDEPEQHLHPRLQRVAARWLLNRRDEVGSQWLLATHSPHFLRGDPEAAYTYIRDVPWLQSDTFTPHDIDAFTSIAADMGFDRGELLSTIGLVVFVEGETDRVLLHAVAGAELRQHGVLVIPIGGVARAEHKGVVDSEMILRLTAAPTAIVVDKLIETEIDLWLRDASARRKAMEAKGEGSTERRELARVIDRGLRLDRIPAPIGIGVPDIFDLVDAEVLSERYHFPGHKDARALAGPRWKQTYKERWRIDVLDPSLFRELGDEMVRRRNVTPELRRLVDRLIELSECSP